jgi:hypothetical protein
VVSGNPLADIRNTRNAHTVIRGGEVFDSQALKDSVKGKLN